MTRLVFGEKIPTELLPKGGYEYCGQCQCRYRLARPDDEYLRDLLEDEVTWNGRCPRCGFDVSGAFEPRWTEAL